MPETVTPPEIDASEMFAKTFAANNPQTAKSQTIISKDAPPEQAKDAPQQKQGGDSYDHAKDDTLPEVIRKGSAKASEEFRKIRAAEQEYKKKATEYEARIKEYESKPKPTAEPNEDFTKKLTAAETRAKEFEDKLKVLAIERHPDFISHYAKQNERAKTAAMNSVPEAQKPALEKILKLPDSEARTEKIEQLLEDIPTQYGKLQLTNALSKLNEIETERQGELAQAADRLQKLTAQENEKQQQTSADATKRLSDRIAAAKTATAEYDAFKPIEGNEEHNAKIPERQKFVEDFYQGKFSQEMGLKIPGLVQEALHLRETVLPNLRAELEKRDKLIKDMSAASPGLGNTPGKGAQGGEEKDFMSVFTQNAPIKRL